MIHDALCIYWGCLHVRKIFIQFRAEMIEMLSKFKPALIQQLCTRWHFNKSKNKLLTDTFVTFFKRPFPYFFFSGENLRCLRCFSTVSAEDCLAGAKPKTCNNGESICLSHEIHSSMKGSRFVLTCGTRRHYQNLQKYCMKPQVSNRVGEVTCKTSLVAPAESEVFTK